MKMQKISKEKKVTINFDGGGGEVFKKGEVIMVYYMVFFRIVFLQL